MDLHPYDGKTRRFRHDDESDKAIGLSLCERLLGTPLGSERDRLRYDLSFASGGFGVFDHLAISVEATDARATAIAEALGFVPARVAFENESVLNMIGADPEDPGDSPPDLALRAFVDDHKADFQPELASVDAAWIDPDAGVNHWALFHVSGGWLHYLEFYQG